MNDFEGDIIDSFLLDCCEDYAEDPEIYEEIGESIGRLRSYLSCSDFPEASDTNVSV